MLVTFSDIFPSQYWPWCPLGVLWAAAVIRQSKMRTGCDHIDLQSRLKYLHMQWILWRLYPTYSWMEYEPSARHHHRRCSHPDLRAYPLRVHTHSNDGTRHFIPWTFFLSYFTNSQPFYDSISISEFHPSMNQYEMNECLTYVSLIYSQFQVKCPLSKYRCVLCFPFDRSFRPKQLTVTFVPLVFQREPAEQENFCFNLFASQSAFEKWSSCHRNHHRLVLAGSNVMF